MVHSWLFKGITALNIYTLMLTVRFFFVVCEKKQEYNMLSLFPPNIPGYTTLYTHCAL